MSVKRGQREPNPYICMVVNPVLGLLILVYLG